MNWKNFLNESSDKPIVPFIVGPTASGKTAAAIDLANSVDGEIISADSMQIYKYMDIGTAKPTPEERSQAVHHLIDFVEPDEDYSVAAFYHDATEKIEDIFNRGKTPIICGGTGLYINALSKPFVLDQNTTDTEIRQKLEKEAQTWQGRTALYERLKTVDPESCKIIHPNNIKRVIRALEIYEVTGRPKSEIDREGQNKTLPYEPVLLMPNMERDVLYDRINMRVDKMIEEGLIEEVLSLDKKYGRDHTSMQALGYKEFYDYLDGLNSLDESIRILKRDTRHFAKRQLTWFRRDKRIKNY